MKALILFLPVMFVLVSCGSVRCKQLIGKEPVDLSGEGGRDLNGEWDDGDGGVGGRIKVINAAKGEILWFEPKQEGQKQEKPIKMFIRSTGDYTFLNVEPDENGERRWWLLGGDENVIILWMPDAEAFRKLIAEGKIKGKNDPEPKPKQSNGSDGKKDEVPYFPADQPGAVIDDPKGEWVEKLVEGEFGVPFHWKEPLILRKKKK